MPETPLVLQTPAATGSDGAASTPKPTYSTIDQGEVPHATGQNGYDWDGYSDPCQLGDIHNANIPFHNYRQIHVSENAFVAGVEAPSIKQIPACPPKWTDVAHYWVIVSLAGYLFAEFFVRKGELKDTSTGKLNLSALGINWWSIGIKIVAGLGSVGALEFIKNAILPMVGITI
jgi:hypothetical protein